MDRALGKVLKIAAVGVFLWSMSLAWPEVNLMLTPPVMTSLVVLATGLTLGIALAGFWYARHKQLTPGLDYVCLEGTIQKKINRDRHPSQPLHITSI